MLTIGTMVMRIVSPRATVAGCAARLGSYPYAPITVLNTMACIETPRRMMKAFAPKYIPSRRRPVLSSSSSTTSAISTSTSTNNPDSPRPMKAVVAIACARVRTNRNGASPSAKRKIEAATALFGPIRVVMALQTHTMGSATTNIGASTSVFWASLRPMTYLQ